MSSSFGFGRNDRAKVTIVAALKPVEIRQNLCQATDNRFRFARWPLANVPAPEGDANVPALAAGSLLMVDVTRPQPYHLAGPQPATIGQR
jgi:hypothetical protein